MLFTGTSASVLGFRVRRWAPGNDDGTLASVQRQLVIDVADAIGAVRLLCLTFTECGLP